MILSVVALLWFCLLTTASDTLESSPWVGWRKGYEYYDKAGEFRENNQFEKALEFYTKSRDYFAAVSQHFPNWNQSVVKGRIRLCNSEIEAMKKLLPAARRPAQEPVKPQSKRRRKRNITPQLPLSDSNNQLPVRRDYTDSGYGSAAPSAGGNSGRLYIEMQSEIEQYRQRLRNALMEIDSLQIKLRQSEARARDIDGVLRDYRLLQDKYSLLELQYRNAAERAAAGGNNERYENQIIALKQANDDALKTIRTLEEKIRTHELDYARSRTEVLQLRDNVQKLTDEKKRIQRNLELQNNKSLAVNSDALNSRINALESELKRKDQRIDRLMRLLNENPSDGMNNSAALTSEIRRLQTQLDNLRKNPSDDPELRRRISELTANESLLKKQLAENTALTDLQTKELKAMREADKKQKTLLTDTQTTLDSLKKRNQELAVELKKYADRYAEISQRHQTRLQSDAANHEKLLAEKRTAEKNLLDLRQKLRKLNESHENLQRELSSAQELIKSSRAAVLETRAKQQSSEIELKKMAALQKAYDEMKARFDLFKQASNSDVLTALNRIPGLEESLKRYEKENSSLISQIADLKNQLRRKSGNANMPDFTNMELEKLEKLLADARSAEARGNQEIAIWGYRQVLARDRNNQEAAASLGRIYLQHGKFAEAEKLLGAVAKNNPGNSKHINNYARALIGKRDYKGALKLLADFKKRNQGSSNAAMLLTEAVAWSRSGKNDAAEKSFKGVLQLEPDNAEAAYELALMLSANEKRRKEAGEFYMLAKSNGIAIDSYLEDLLRSFSGPDLATRDFLLTNAAEALNRGENASAAWYLAEIKKLYPQDKEYIVMQAGYNILTNQPGAALQILANAPGSRQDFLKALALTQSGKTDQAAALLPKLTVLKNNDLPEALKKFTAEQSVKSNKKAQQIYAALLKKLP